MRGFGAQNTGSYLSFRETFIQQDPSLDWVFDSGGLPVREHKPGEGHTWGTDDADAVRGSLTEGDGIINGMNGKDVIYGTDRDELLINETGDAMIVAGGGNDTIWAGADDDILDGGTGNDVLMGERGNDTYIFRRGSGQDTIIDPDPTPGNTDTIWLGSNLTPDDITLRRSGNNLVLKINDTTDTLTVQDFFKNDSLLNRVERIEFMDGTTWTEADIISKANAPTEGDDFIWLSPENDNLNALGGNDTIYGREGDDILDGGTGSDSLYGGPGDDILDGGPGNDLLDGGLGNDTYLFGRGYGQDTIIDQDTTPGNLDTILLGEGVLPTDIKLERLGNDVKLTVPDTLDSITVKNWLQNDTPTTGIEVIKFADGTEWGTEEIQDILVKGTEGNDLIYGFSRPETIEGLGGDDTVFARGGDDILVGGPGNDALYGEAGNDTLIGGEGRDILVGGYGDDTFEGGPGNDYLYGGQEADYRWYRDDGNGNDIYVFGRGSGQDYIVDSDRTYSFALFVFLYGFMER